MSETLWMFSMPLMKESRLLGLDVDDASGEHFVEESLGRGRL
tara:strand:- start:5837 stop:5962 length:126 start_codon:yes stop_codon:yes gene_type:complete